MAEEIANVFPIRPRFAAQHRADHSQGKGQSPALVNEASASGGFTFAARYARRRFLQINHQG
jgi:hypothetical protein